MEGVWDDEYEEDDFLDNYGEALEVPDPETRAKLVEGQEGPEPKKRRIVQNPRPKLDPERLLSDERGLPELLRKASNMTYKKGHEIKYMRTALAQIEHWSHRLFSKYTFDDFLQKCETQGKKRPIKTHLRKVRIGMIGNDDDEVPKSILTTTDE